MARDLRDDMRGSFLLTDTPALREHIQNVVGCFHIRDAAKNPDGSRGTIRMSPDELRDALAFMARGGLDPARDAELQQLRALVTSLEEELRSFAMRL